MVSVENRTGKKIGFGSGFLVDDKGLVVTNWHVIARAGKAEIQFRDGTKIGVKGLRAFDVARDVAILELEKPPTKAKPLPLGPRTPPTQGDPVMAIGHPRGLNFSATEGIVSAIRKNSDKAPVKPEDDRIWVQTTAAIAGGSSGGPLLSDSGDVIGINTLVLEERGVAFAVHVSHVIDLFAKAKGASVAPLPGNPSSDQYNPLANFEPGVLEVLEDYTRRNGPVSANAGKRASVPACAIEAKDHPGPKYARRLVQMAERERHGPMAFQALYMACLVDKPDGSCDSLKRALDLILEDHVREKWLGKSIPGLAGQPNEAVTGFLRKVLAQTPHAEVKAVTCFHLANNLKNTPKSNSDEVLSLLRRCSGEFKDVRITLQGENRAEEYVLGELVKPMIFEVENLSVGRKAPEIVGTDVDGKTFKLSDYRGKVVVVDFFADWCPFCVKMYPEERELVATLAGKPFALVGVNCDSRETLRQIIEDKKITWRCWADGKGGPICETWQLDGYPLMYVLDQDGVIRFKFTGQTNPGVLKQTVKKLMEAMPAGKDTEKAEKAEKAEKVEAKSK